MENKSFQDIFKELRIEKKLSQDKISEELDISSSLVSKWENGISTPGPEMLEYIADYFQVSVDYLIGRTTNRSFNDEKIYTTSIIVDEKYKVKFETEVPFESLSKEEQDKLTQEALDGIFEIRRSLKNKN